ncbi:hypothetical protein PSY31_22200, partial [Shigella flexneri]|nr:hypothetical protein [Shigella flexneri]
DVRSQNPRSLLDAIAVAKRQEAAVNSLIDRVLASPSHRTQPKFLNRQGGQQQNRSRPAPSQFKRRVISDAEMKERFEKKLCYKCGDPYVHGHQCKVKQLYALMDDVEVEDSPTIDFLGENCEETAEAEGGYSIPQCH